MTRRVNWGHMTHAITIFLDGRPTLLAARLLADGTDSRPLVAAKEVPPTPPWDPFFPPYVCVHRRATPRMQWLGICTPAIHRTEARTAADQERSLASSCCAVGSAEIILLGDEVRTAPPPIDYLFGPDRVGVQRGAKRPTAHLLYLQALALVVRLSLPDRISMSRLSGCHTLDKWHFHKCTAGCIGDLKS